MSAHAVAPGPAAPGIGGPARVVVPPMLPPAAVAPMPGPAMAPTLSQMPRARAVVPPGGVAAESEGDEPQPTLDARRQR